MFPTLARLKEREVELQHLKYEHHDAEAWPEFIMDYLITVLSGTAGFFASLKHFETTEIIEDIEDTSYDL